MDRAFRALIVSPSETEAARLRTVLRRQDSALSYSRINCLRDVDAALESSPPDLVLVDFTEDCVEIVPALRVRDPELPIIVIVRPEEEAVAIAALQALVDDYVVRGNDLRLRPAVARALREAAERRVRRETEAALRASEERYRELVENANDIVFTTDLQGNFTSLNAAGEHISGYTRDEVCRMNMAQFLAPESLQVAQNMIRLKLLDNRPTVYEVAIISRDGRQVPLELSTRLIYHAGAPVGIQGVARDITERKRAAEILAEREKRYRGLFENASDVVYTHDLDGNFTSVNPAAERVTGYTPDELLHFNIGRIVAPEHVERARQMMQYKVQHNRPTTYELDIVTRAGERSTLEINSQLIFDGGKPVGVQGIARDVTERRRAEAELREREQKQAAVAELGQKALAISDLDALFDQAVHCVSETLDIKFCTVTELLEGGQTLQARAMQGWDASLLGDATIDAGRGSQAGYTLLSSEPVVVEDLRTEQRFTVPAILERHGAVSGTSVIIHGQGAPFGVLSAFTDRRRVFSRDDVHFLQAVANVLATAIQRKHLEDERTRQSVELATRVLQAQEEERKRIARELHDGSGQTLSMLLVGLDLLDTELPEGSDALRTQFDRFRGLVKRTLDEIRALAYDLRPTILDDFGLVAALEWLATDYEEVYGTTVEVEADPEATQGLTPEEEVALFRISQEALTNCGKHAQADRVRLSLGLAGERARLVIEDNGRGFDAANVSGPTREGRLGLYGMQERAVLLGGSFQIDTVPEQGTKLTIEVPWAHPARAPEAVGP